MRLFFATAFSGFFAGAISSTNKSNTTTTQQSSLFSFNNNNAFCAAADTSSSSPSLSSSELAAKKETMSDAVSMSLNFSEHRKKKKEEMKQQKEKEELDKKNNPTSTDSPNSNNSTGPVRLVIVGGGYAGSELAYKLDSVFDVTLIDEKNFVENRMEMVKVLCSPWDSTNQDPAQHSQAIAAANHFIHRVYLRRANVVTGKVDFVQFDPPSGRKQTKKAAMITNSSSKQNTDNNNDNKSNILSKLPKTLGGLGSSHASTEHDEKKKFVRLKDGRVVPFDLIVFATGEEHAFPFSTKQRTSDQRLAEVKHFCEYMSHCHKVAVVGGGPLGCSVAGYLAAGRPDMTVDLYNNHPQLLFRLPKNMRQIAEETLNAYSNLNIFHSSTVEDVTSHIIDARKDKSGSNGGFWTSLLGGGSSGGSAGGDVSSNLDKAIELTNPKSLTQDDQNNNNTNSEIDISFDLQVRKYPDPPKQKNPSIFVRCWMGDDFRGELPALDPNEKSRQAADRLKQSTSMKQKGYDYVFVCTGGVPRSELFHNSPELRGHVDSKGHIRVSKYFQLYGYPEAFAVGRSCALPFVRSVGNSNLMSNTMFRAMMSRFGEGASNNQVMSKMSQDAHCIVPQRFSIPRISIPLGPGEQQVVACGAWYGPTGGENAAKEKKSEIGLFKEFKAPKFFKAQQPQKVRERFEKWSESASTPVVDFTYTAEIA